jgi:hypothetical protein
VRAGVTINALDSKGVYNTRALTTSPNVEGRAANYPISLGGQPDEANNEILEDLAEVPAAVSLPITAIWRPAFSS